MLNLTALNAYRIQNREEFREYLRQNNVIITGLNTDGDGLAVHHPSCRHLQNAYDNVDLKNYPKFVVKVQDFPTFRARANDARVPLTYQCTSIPCLQGRQNVGIE